MARDKRDDEGETGDETGAETENESGGQRASRFQLWLEEAWEGWLKSVGVIILCAIAYLLYKFDLINEGLAGALLVGIILVGTIASVALPSWEVVRGKPPRQKALYVTMLVAWVVASAYPSLRASLRPAPLGEATVTQEGQTVTVKTGKSGPYELTVSGRLKARRRRGGGRVQPGGRRWRRAGPRRGLARAQGGAGAREPQGRHFLVGAGVERAPASAAERARG